VFVVLLSWTALTSAKPHPYFVSAEQPSPYGGQIRVRPHFHHHQTENNDVPQSQRFERVNFKVKSPSLA